MSGICFKVLLCSALKMEENKASAPRVGCA